MSDKTAIEQEHERKKMEVALQAQSEFCNKIRNALNEVVQEFDLVKGMEDRTQYFRSLAGTFDYEFRMHLQVHGEIVTAPLMRALTEAAGMGYMMANKMQVPNADKKRS